MNWININDEFPPKTGELFDVWCIPPEKYDFELINDGVRLCDVCWLEVCWELPKGMPINTGFYRITDDGNMDMVERDAEDDCPLGLPEWIVTHWMKIPTKPKDKNE